MAKKRPKVPTQEPQETETPQAARAVLIWEDEEGQIKWDVQGNWMIIDLLTAIANTTEQIRLRGIDAGVDKKVRALLEAKDESSKE